MYIYTGICVSKLSKHNFKCLLGESKKQTNNTAKRNHVIFVTTAGW